MLLKLPDYYVHMQGLVALKPEPFPVIHLCVCVVSFLLHVSDGARPVSRPSPRHLGVHDEVLRE